MSISCITFVVHLFVICCYPNSLFFLFVLSNLICFLQFAVFEAAQAAIMDNKIDKDVATTLKKKFDAHDTYGGTWHCIVGKNFGCSITHETQYSMFFEINGQHFLLFKSKD
jgi:dynein light chain LC8-type